MRGRQQKRKKKVLSAAAIFAAGILAMSMLTACGSSNTGTEKESSSASASSEGGITTDEKETLIYAGEAVSTINPILNQHDELPNLIFSGLMKYNAEGKPVEDLAKSYQFDEKTNTYTFQLRKNVKWQDGKKFTAEDVVYTYNELTQDDKLTADITSNYDDITSVKALNDYTVSIQLKQYNAAILDYFTMGILPKHLCAGEDLNTTKFNQHPVGTGRYKFVSWDTSNGVITLEANQDYYGKVPNIKYIAYKTVSDETTKATMLKSGEADLAWLNASYAKQFKDDSGNAKDGYHTWDFATADYRGAAMDMSSDFWKQNSDSIGVLNYALDKESIVKSVLNNQGETAYSPIQRNPFGSNKKADIYTYDLDKFDQKMEKLGWKKNSDGIYERNGQEFEFTIQVREYEEERVDIANIMADQLEKAGVKMDIKLVSAFDWDAGYDGFLAGFATPFDPDMIYSQFVTDASGNTMHYSNARVDKLLKEGRHTKSTEKRKKIYGKFEEVYARHPGILLVAYLDGNYVGTDAVDGLDTTRVLGHHAVGVMWNIEDWTLNKS